MTRRPANPSPNPSRSLATPEAEKLALVRRWYDDRETWSRTKKGPDGTVFPPSWPLANVETEALIYALAWLCNGIADELNTAQIVTDPEAQAKYVEQARQLAISVPRQEATP